MSRHYRDNDHEMDSAREWPTQRAGQIAPAKRTRTMALGSAGAGAAVQRKASAQRQADGPDMARQARSGPVEDWTPVVFRPDIHQTPVQRKHAGEIGTLMPDLQPTGPGQALPAAVQAKMETAFATDFSAVRVHEGPQASAMGALAYAQGADIHFAPGQYDPESVRGQELLGHELAHVVQQSRGRVAAPGQGKGLPVNDDPSLEREADEQGARAARGQPAHGAAPASAGPAVIGRDSARPVQRLKDKKQAVDITKLDYHQAYAYLIKLREKQVDDTAHPDVEFDMDKDPDALQKHIDQLEPEQGSILCAEGQAKRAGKEQQIDFGAVTSCLTFTCMLSDGAKIVAHEAVKNRVPGGAVAAIKKLADKDKDNKIDKVLIAGVAGSWTWKDGVLAPLAEDDTNLIAKDADGFASAFAAAIGAAKGEFIDHVAGDVVIDADGAYQDPLAAADKALQDHLEDTDNYQTTKQAATAHLAKAVFDGDMDQAAKALENLLDKYQHYEKMVVG